MQTIVLISCCKTKLEVDYPVPAENLYQSEGFRKRLAYARLLNPDFIFVLSAKHHIVPLTKLIKPYDVCLADKSTQERKEWASICWQQLDEFSDRQKDNYIILAGKDYYEELVKGFRHYELPTKGLAQGEQLAWLKTQITCDLIHSFANSLPHFSYPFDKRKLPKNGVYFFFEKGETYKDMDRIVRIGTHTGDGNLPSRLEQHLNNENKDRSIFRKNIGRAMLNRAKDPFLEEWNLDLTSKATKEKCTALINSAKLQATEKQVSEYMRNNFSFAVFEVATKENRLEMEELLIKTISAGESFKASANWLGNSSPEEKIRNNGMWLKQGLVSRTKEYTGKSPKRHIGKYNGLTNSLLNEKSNCVTYTFEKINELISPNCLPKSAYIYRPWWANSISHSHSSAWLNAGFLVSKVTDNSVTFEKI